jgi:multidrug resistance efflux pump
MTRRTRLFLFAAATVGAVALAARSRAPAQRVTVSEGSITERVLVAAVVTPIDGVAEVRPRIEGTVVRVHAREGDTVAAGQLLAEIEADVQTLEARRRRAEVEAASAAASGVAAGARSEERIVAAAEVSATREEAALWRDRLQRLEQLTATGSASDASLTEARQSSLVADARLAAAEAHLKLLAAGGRAEDVKVARARVGSAEAALAAAQVDLDRARIVAPVAGVVLARRVDPGDTVTIGFSAPAFDIADPARTELRLEAEEPDVDALAIGTTVILSRPGGGGEVGTATITRRSDRMDRRTIGADDPRARVDGLVRTAWATWSAPSHEPIGLRLDAWIERSPKKVGAMAPRSAVVVADGAAMVFEPFLAWSRARTTRLGVADERSVELLDVPAGTVLVVPR